MSKHLLMTAWGFAPARTSGVYRALGVANAFAQGGWRVTVLTAPEEIFRDEGIVDPSLSRIVDPRVDIRRVPFSSGVHSVDVTRWTRSQARQPELWAWWHGRRFPEHSFGGWRAELTKAALGVHRSDAVDLTLGTASPSVDFIPGWVLKRHRGVPTIMDYRDAWTFDVFTGRPNPRVSRRANDWETRLIGHADRIWFVNDRIRGWHSAKYPGAATRMITVPNGFDAPAGVSLGVPFTAAPVDAGLTFGYVGTINTGQFPGEELLAGWNLAREQSRLIGRSRLVLRGHLGRAGVADAELESYLMRARQAGISYEGPVAKAQVMDAYREFDALVLALASGPGVTSGKVFEYAATGLPIVSVHDPSAAVAPFMASSPVWTPTASLSPQDIATAIIATAELTIAQSAQTRRDAIRWGEQWERENQLRNAVQNAEELVKARS